MAFGEKKTFCKNLYQFGQVFRPVISQGSFSPNDKINAPTTLEFKKKSRENEKSPIKV